MAIERRPRIVPMTLKAARRFVEENHRHTLAPPGGLFAIGLSIGEATVGCAIIGRPVARRLADGVTCEVTRLCTDGTPMACSMLYSAAARAAKAMGYKRIVTYTLQSEPGTSLRASGWMRATGVKGTAWARPREPRTDRVRDLFDERRKYSTEDKWRWERAL